VSRTRRKSVAEVRPSGRTGYDKGIEVAWLVALAMVPLSFSGKNWLFFFTEPKQYFLHLAALTIVVLWAAEWAFAARAPLTLGTERRSAWDLIGWAKRSPWRWALVFAGAFLFWQLLSTLYSPLPVLSALGRDPNNPGAELYSSASLVVIFFAVALRVRTQQQVRRILVVIAVTGSLTGAYGVAQYFGWDPVGYGASLDRVYSTFGNPIYFGSFLVMSIPITFSLAMAWDMRGRWRLPALMALFAVALGFQLAGLWFTGSRGPWISAAVAVALSGIGTLLWFRRQQIIRAVVVWAGVIAVALVLILVPEGSRRELGRLTSIVQEVSGAAAAATNEATTGASRIPDQPIGTFGARVLGWQASLRLATSWKSVYNESTLARSLRPALGYGPEMALYNFQLEVPIQTEFRPLSNAHNFALHMLVETGWVGVTLYITMLSLCAAAAVMVVRRQVARGRTGDLITVATVAMLAVFAGRIMEQSTGIARLSDLVVFWTVLGLLIAIARVGDLPQSYPSIQVRPERHRRAAGVDRPLAAGLAIAAAISAGLLFLLVDVQALRASRLASRGDAAIVKKEANTAYQRYTQASALNPSVEVYSTVINRLLRNTANDIPDDAVAMKSLGPAYDALANFEDHDPYAYATQIRLALTLMDIARRGEEGVINELVVRLEKLARLLRPFPEVQAFVAQGLAGSGENERAIEVADGVIQSGIGGEILAQAWWVRGVAHAALDRNEEAEVAYRTAMELQPGGTYGSRAQKSLVELLDKLGRSAEADQYRAGLN
jgi:O-antigen ligase